MSRRLRRATWLSLALATMVRLTVAPLRALSADEAYYLCAARRGHGAWPIEDHPPLLGAFLALADRLVPGPIELRVRAVAALLAVVTALGVGRLASLLAAPDRREQSRWLAILVATWGLMPMVGGLIATPDAPLLAASAWLFAFSAERDDRLVDDGCRAALSALVVASKAIGAPIVLILAIAEVVRGRPRRAVALLLGALVAAPLALTSTIAQARHAVGLGPLVGAPYVGPLAALFALAIGQLFLWSPPLVVQAFRKATRATLPRPLAAVCAGIALMVLASALIAGRPPEPNWTAPAALALLAATAVTLVDAQATWRHVVVAVAIAPTLLALSLWSTPRSLLPNDPLERTPPRARLDPTRAETRYGAAAWRCLYRDECTDIDTIFNAYP